MAKMKMKKVDFKQLLVQKGEQIGLGVAGAVCALMILPLFWFLFFGESSKALVDNLNTSAAALKNKQNTSVPGKADEPPENSATNAELTRQTVEKSKYPFHQLFMLPAQEDSTKRQLVHVLLPDEGRVDVALAQLKTYVLQRKNDGWDIMKLIDPNMTSGSANPYNYGQLQSAYKRGRGNGPSGSPGAPPSGRPGGGRRPGRGYSPYGAPNPSAYGALNTNKPDLHSEWISTDDITALNKTTERLADKTVPVRMAIITASFPYHKQIREFQDRLHLASESLVVDETAPNEKDPSKVRHTFSFLSPLVERRMVDVHGNPLEEWTAINLAGEQYYNLLRANGLRFETESDELDPICFDGLVMSKMETMRKDQYPQGERKLKEVQTTLTALANAAKKAEGVIKPKSAFSTEGFDPYARQQPSEANSTENGSSGIPPMPGTNKKKQRYGESGSSFPPTGRPGTGQQGPTGIVPEYCLIRLIDVTIEPGKFYQYRIKVRMANPNFGMTNVASPTYATDETPLVSADWFEIRPKSNVRPQAAAVPLVGGELLSVVVKQNSERPQVVAVPPEYHLYTVDQQEIDYAAGKKYTGQNAGEHKDRQVALQIHKWLEVTDENRALPSLPVGEWSVAERVLAYRGEYIGRKQRVEVPYWRSVREMFVLAVDKLQTGRFKKSGLEIDFGPRIPDGTPADPPYYPILVDFNGGPMTRSRVTGKDKDGKPEVVRVDDRKVGVETLILSPDGKLLAEHSWTDAEDPQRIKRLDEWRQRIEDVKHPKTTGSGAPGSGDYFGPKKMP